MFDREFAAIKGDLDRLRRDGARDGRRGDRSAVRLGRPGQLAVAGRGSRAPTSTATRSSAGTWASTPTGTIVRTDDEHLVVTVGLKDCIVVHTPNATLVANKHDEEEIRQIVKELEARGWTEYL